VALPNRVAPDGTLFATTARGLLMGNRGGRFHDTASHSLKGSRRWASKAWICCRLAFKGRPSPGVWGPHRYTELFFCDEVTALAAGHRPCMECRRADALAWRSAVVTGLAVAGVPPFPALDDRLHGERLAGRDKRLHPLAADALPDGAMLRRADGTFVALRGASALPWSPGGYGPPLRRPTGIVDVLTPPTSLAALAGGYRPTWHPGAGTAEGPPAL
jgi:hypothetical protein